MKLICTLTAAAALGLAAALPASPMGTPKLYGTVGPGFTITLKQNGKLVRTLHPGTYTFVIWDRSGIHNFQVEGNRLDRALTSVGFTGHKTVTIVLRRGTYKYYCAPHESSMFGHFKVA
jgi:hypothetical protein